MDTRGEGRDNGMGHGRVVRCLSRIAALTRGMLVTSSHTRPVVHRAHLIARVRERIEHTNEICRVSLGCILALGSLFFSFLISLSLSSRSPSPFILSPFIFFFSPAICHSHSLASPARRRIRMKTKKGWSELARGQGRPRSFSPRGMTSDFALSFTGAATRTPRAVPAGRRRIRALEINPWRFHVRESILARRYVPLTVAARRARDIFFFFFFIYF